MNKLYIQQMFMVILISFCLLVVALVIAKSLNYRVDMETKLDSCLNTAQMDYSLAWNNTCYKLGKEESCLLPSQAVERLDNLKKESKDECFKRYGN